METNWAEIMAMMIEDANKTQKWRRNNPCCANCKHYYTDYGCDLCKKNDIIPEDVDDIYKGKCNGWE